MQAVSMRAGKLGVFLSVVPICGDKSGGVGVICIECIECCPCGLMNCKLHIGAGVWQLAASCRQETPATSAPSTDTSTVFVSSCLQIETLPGLGRSITILGSPLRSHITDHHEMCAQNYLEGCLNCFCPNMYWC